MVFLLTIINKILVKIFKLFENNLQLKMDNIATNFGKNWHFRKFLVPNMLDNKASAFNFSLICPQHLDSLLYKVFTGVRYSTLKRKTKKSFCVIINVTKYT